jgi:hypothetical protein
MFKGYTDRFRKEHAARGWLRCGKAGAHAARSREL